MGQASTQSFEQEEAMESKKATRRSGKNDASDDTNMRPPRPSGDAVNVQDTSQSRKRGRTLPIGRGNNSAAVKDDVSIEDTSSEDDVVHSDQEMMENSGHTATSNPDEDESEDDEDLQQTSMDMEESSGNVDEEEDQDEDNEDTDVESYNDGLQARMPDGTVAIVSLVVNHVPFDEDSLDGGDAGTGVSAVIGGINSKARLGNDGNLFYCHICGEYGDIVCCDGCPHVFHPTCIPKGDPSRQALDSDQDPWFCPDCTRKNDNGELTASGHQRSGRAVKRKCSECQQSGGTMAACQGGCGVLVHHPSCRMSDDEDADTFGPICSTCRAEEVVTLEEQEMEEAIEEEDESSQIEPKTKKRRRSRGRSMDTSSLEADDSEGGDGDDDEASSMGGSKHKSRSSLRPPGLPLGPGRRKKLKSSSRKKKKRSKSLDHGSTAPARSSAHESDDGIMPARLFTASRGPVKATPAFFFFLGENRFKIERMLSRKHRYFNRMPKGMERNELVAREGALWWTRLRPSEHRRYVNMSIREFEKRIIEWKEEKNIRQMIGGDVDEELGDAGNEDMPVGGDDYLPSLQDENLLYDQHQRLYVSTSVGSKPFVPEQGRSNNKILLELLQDMRFHPEPMISATRSDAEPGQPDHSKMTIPYFEVHGPIATCAGDYCLGCGRGWKHFCPVLKRQLPAIEHRAKLQPPLSSLMATRVGLGLRPRPPTVADEEDNEPQSNELFALREKPEMKEAKELPPIPSFSLAHPSGRADDTVLFIEEAFAMKVPAPPRPTGGSLDHGKKPVLSRGILPTRMHKKENNSAGEEELNKCGRCRTVIKNDTGCIPCRRAQLVINKSKLSAERPGASPSHGNRLARSDPNASLLKVQTTMLGRLSIKDSNFDLQPKGDQAIGNAILSMRWTPNAVLPPQKVQAPKASDSLYFDASADEVDSGSSLSSEEKQEEVGENGGEGETSAGAQGTTEDLDVAMQDAPPRTIYGEELGGEASSQTSQDEHGDENSTGGRKHRSARLKAAAAISGDREPDPSPDRQELAQQRKEEANDLYRRCLSISISGILLALLRRDPLELFAEPVSNVEGYDKVVKDPIDFGEIRSRVLRDRYSSLGAFVSDVRLLCSNALAFNHPTSIYAKTAAELYGVLEAAQKRASEWMGTIKDTHDKYWRHNSTALGRRSLGDEESLNDSEYGDPFQELRTTWPEAVDMLEDGDWAREAIAADFIRTKENETAYYGSLAIRRAAAAAEASLAPYPGIGGTHNVVVRRSPEEDEALRRHVDRHVSESAGSIQLKDFSDWREDYVLRLLRRVQSRRVEGRITSESGGVRCDGLRTEQDAKVTSETFRWGKNRRKHSSDLPRVAKSRVELSTGRSSQKNRERIKEFKMQAMKHDAGVKPVDDVAVSIRGSRIHGWGLYADQHLRTGDVVAEYVGEYITNAVADAREKMYQEQRIQDYQFRVDDSLVIDATKHGGHGRYINHNCDPNCAAKIIEGEPPNQHLKRVMIIAQRDILPLEEITYDYQFPLELDLDQRIPCNCGSPHCRGFMNWDLPEKGSKNRAERTQKRGGNMRDRIRRLGRPLKKERGDLFD